MKPLTRAELYMTAIINLFKGGNRTMIPAKPLTREEAYLDAIVKKSAGETPGEVPVRPFTRKEMYLSEIYKNVNNKSREGHISDNDILFHFEDYKNSGHFPCIFSNKAGYELSDEQSKFGNKSLKVASGPNGYGSCHLNFDFDLADNDFTLDFWSYPTATRDSNCFVAFDYRSLGFYIYSGTTISVGIAYQPSAWADAKRITVENIMNSWHHYACTRDKNTIYVFLDGVLIHTFNIGTNSFPNLSKFGFGTNLNGENYFRGYIDEFRFKIGEAAWTENFTPPTQPYT